MVVLSILFSLICATAHAISPNLVPNPDFDLGIDDWTAGIGTISPSDVDADACSASGSLEITTTGGFDVTPNGTAYSTCFSIPAGFQRAGTRGRLVVSPTTNRVARITVALYSDADCTTAAAQTFSSLVTLLSSTSWTPVLVTFTPSVGNTHAIVTVSATADVSTGAFSARFDRVFLRDAADLFTDDFEIGEACRWKVFSSL